MKTETANRAEQTTNPDQPGRDQSRAEKRFDHRTRRLFQLKTGLKAGDYEWG